MTTSTIYPIALSNEITSCTAPSAEVLDSIQQYLCHLVAQGGPQPSEYPYLNMMIEVLAGWLRTGALTPEQWCTIRDTLGEAISTQTIQGMALQKPHGYAGDYEIIERIYQYYVSDNPQLANWDKFFHSHSAPKAVRNRVSYFLSQVWDTHLRHPEEAYILNLASGPGRDMYEALKVLGKTPVYFDCIDQDKEAIDYASRLCAEYLTQITFFHCNVFRFKPVRSYHLIWSAGLFDYFTDALFKRVVKRLLPALVPGGKLVIGNFSDRNPSKSYMELFDWILYHRNEQHLQKLAEDCGVAPSNISIEQEPEGVNLFLHITQT